MRRALCLTAAVLLLCSTTVNGVCVLKLNVSSSQSPWSGGGKTTVPTPGIVTSSNMSATGNVYLQVPTDTCPPTGLAGNDAQSLLEKSSLLLPIGSPSILFKPQDIKSNISAGGSTIAVFNFDDLELGFTGNEPLGTGAVKLGAGTAAEAKAAAQEVCSQLVMLGGVLNLTSALGPRTANVKNVAYNRSMAVGASIKEDGAKLPTVLYIRNGSLFLNISPETTPGVQFSKATYLLSGDVVATADLSSPASWQQIDAAKADWGAVPRADAPVVIAIGEPGPQAKPRIIGVNSTAVQQCTPSRTLSASGSVDAAPPPAAGAGAPAAQKGAAGDRSSASMLRVLLAGAVGAVLAVLAL